MCVYASVVICSTVVYCIIQEVDVQSNETLTENVD